MMELWKSFQLLSSGELSWVWMWSPDDHWNQFSDPPRNHFQNFRNEVTNLSEQTKNIIQRIKNSARNIIQRITFKIFKWSPGAYKTGVLGWELRSFQNEPAKGCISHPWPPLRSCLKKSKTNPKIRSQISLCNTPICVWLPWGDSSSRSGHLPIFSLNSLKPFHVVQVPCPANVRTKYRKSFNSAEFRLASSVRRFDENQRNPLSPIKFTNPFHL